MKLQRIKYTKYDTYDTNKFIKYSYETPTNIVNWLKSLNYLVAKELGSLIVKPYVKEIETPVLFE